MVINGKGVLGLFQDIAVEFVKKRPDPAEIPAG
jgi:hypothetical protein